MLDSRNDVLEVTHADLVPAIANSDGIRVLIEKMVDLRIVWRKVDAAEISVRSVPYEPGAFDSYQGAR